MSIIEARRATVADAAALTRLRALMLADMGADVGETDAPWRKAAEDWFAAQLAMPETFAAFVVDDPSYGVVCSAAGSRGRSAPNPGNLDGAFGHVFNVSTEPAWRRQGLARICMVALLDWFRDTGVAVVNLNSTADGQALYQSLGFAPPRFPALQLRT